MEVPIIPVVIIANDFVEVMQENPNSHMVIRANQIGALISEYQDALSYETQKKIAETFEKHQLDANDFPVKINAERANYAKELVKEYIPYMKTNAEIAEVHRKHMKQAAMISWGIIGVLAALCMAYSFTDHWLGIIWSAIVLGITCTTESTLSWICGIVAMVALMVTLSTGSAAVLAVAILGTAGNFLLSQKADEAQEE